MEDYQIATYVDLGFWWWMAAGVTVVALAPEATLAGLGIKAVAPWVGRAALVVDVVGLVKDSLRLDILPGPTDATYPTVYYEPLHIGRSSWQLHFTAPEGIAE
jgi:hypothetical protein